MTRSLRFRPAAALAPLALAGLLAACGESATLPLAAGTGPSPTLPTPNRTLFPTVDIAPARGWTEGAAPTAAPGLAVAAYATGLDHPRWLHVLPNGDVLVAESNAPERPQAGGGLRGFAMQQVMKRAGAGAGVPSADRITLLRGLRPDGSAELRTVFATGLASPFGMAHTADAVYVATTDAVLRWDYAPGMTRVGGPGERVVDLPAGPRNHHWTKSLIASPDGSRLYATVGSNSNVAEHGLAEEEGRAAIWEIDPKAKTKRLYATGLRNPNGMAWVGRTLWTAVNERDELGSDLVPDYMTSVRDGGFYGWPWSYFGATVDARVQPPRPDKVATALVPDYALGPHTASLGLAAAGGNALGAPFASGMFVGQHGSWNRRPLSGYKVVFVPFAGTRPTGEQPMDVLGGFLDADGNARGRPVGVAVAADGALLVADDVGNAVWRVTARR
jgi:glucose/arabinose dehydrogenase